MAVAAGEQMIVNEAEVNWEGAVAMALSRQGRHFDAKPPTEISEVDKDVAMQVAKNLARILGGIRAEDNAHSIVIGPLIPGFRWISSSEGDFSIGSKLVEVKCTGKNFSSADYRQLIIYWMLSYAAALEGKGTEWSEGLLVNPRHCSVVRFAFDDLLNTVSSGRSKVELLEAFSAMIGHSEGDPDCLKR